MATRSMGWVRLAAWDRNVQEGISEGKGRTVKESSRMGTRGM